MSTKPTVVTARTNFTRNYYDIQEDTDAAKRILRDPLQMSWFEKAQRKPGQKTEFWLNTWTCPYCGTEHPEYRKDSFVGAVAEEELEDFFDDQSSLFEKDNKRIIPIQDVSTEDRAHICRNCNRFSTSDSEPLIAVFQRTKTRSRNELKVTLLHVPFKELFNMSGLPGFRIEDADPRVTFTESVVFNFNRGRTFLALEEEDYLERIIAIRDITNSLWSDGPLFRAVFLHPLLNQSFYEQFNDSYPEENPFPREEMTPMQYVHLCRFQGFPKFFYDSIPFSLEQPVTLETPFRKVAKHLHTRGDAIAMVKRELPYDSKEIRRILFSEKLELLFFPRELKVMVEVLRMTADYLRHMKRYAKREEPQLQDLAESISLDLFVKYLRLPSAVSVASEIQAYPGTVEFLHVLLEQVGPRRMLSLLEHASSQVFMMGERYAYAAPFKKKEMLNTGIKLCKDKYNWDPLPGSCSEPIPTKINGDLKEMWIGNYRFKPVTCKQEYARAAEQLHNCLMSWCNQPDPTPIVIVYYQFKIVAAIEVLPDEKTVQQAYLSYNRAVENDPALYPAYRIWLERSGLKELEYDY